LLQTGLAADQGGKCGSETTQKTFIEQNLLLPMKPLMAA
jgi:hypothetical protein